ncbi:hypothetical protein V6615_15175 [Oscillospiraceae bacterium PP1C4]
MNRFPNRVLSLILAVVFLFSAAGISFMLLFKGTTVFATTEINTIQSVKAYNYKSDGSIDDQITSIVSNINPFKLIVTVIDNRFTMDDIYEKNSSSSVTSESSPIIDETIINQFSVSINTDVFCPVAAPNETIVKKPVFSNFKSVKGDSVSYTITFDRIKYTGKEGNIKLGISYPTQFGLGRANLELEVYELSPNKSSSSYDSSSRRNRDDDDDDDSSSSRPDIAPPTPNIIVSEYSYGGGTVTAASNFALTVKFTNTSKKLPIDNIVMKVSVPEAFTMTSSSNTFYIDKMSKQSSVERTINLSVKPNAEPISHPIKLNFTFEAVIDEARKQYTSEQEISIPVAQLDRFLLNPVEVPAEVYMGEDSSVSATFINKGKTVVYNVTAEITGNISQPGQRQFIGNVEGGKDDSADFLISALEPGTVSGEIIITYEDANMNVNELRTPFTTTAIAMDVPPVEGEMAINPEDMPPDTAVWYKTVPVWGWMVGGVVLVIFAAFTIKLVRARRQKKLEEQDEDI